MDYKIETIKSSSGVEYDVLVLPKEITSEEVDKFEKELLRLLKKEKPMIVLDFSKTNFMCSRGVGIIAYVLGKVNKKGGKLELVSLGKFVKKLFEVVQLDKIFNIYPDLETFSKNN